MNKIKQEIIPVFIYIHEDNKAQAIYDAKYFKYPEIDLLIEKEMVNKGYIGTGSGCGFGKRDISFKKL